MRGITTLIVMASLFAMAMLIGVPVFDQLAPLATEMTPDKYNGTIGNIHETGVKWIVVVFIGTIITWAVFWILRQERQEVR